LNFIIALIIIITNIIVLVITCNVKYLFISSVISYMFIVLLLNYGDDRFGRNREKLTFWGLLKKEARMIVFLSFIAIYVFCF